VEISREGHLAKKEHIQSKFQILADRFPVLVLMDGWSMAVPITSASILVIKQGAGRCFVN
jgi:hypothetical protein